MASSEWIVEQLRLQMTAAAALNRGWLRSGEVLSSPDCRLIQKLIVFKDWPDPRVIEEGVMSKRR